MSKALEAAAKAISEVIGPPVGNPEYLAKHADRLAERHRQTAAKFARAAISAYFSALEEDGWKLVPVEATEEMKAALMAKSPLNAMRCKLAWDAMIAAAPTLAKETTNHEGNNK